MDTHFTHFSLAMQFGVEDILNGVEDADLDVGSFGQQTSAISQVFEQDLWNMDDLIDWGDFPELAGSIVQSPSQPVGFGKKRSSNMSNRCPRPKRMKITHNHVCDIHQVLPDSKPSCQCFGKFSLSGRYKGARCTRMVSSFVPGQLPVCSQHNSQIIPMMRCEAILECGFPCDEMAPWKPHGYRLCASHWSRGKCFLKEVPYEIRLMIYRYLVPNQQIPARNRLWGQLRVDGTAPCTTIFRVNKSIHEEFAEAFYGSPTFQIDVSNVYWKSGQFNKIFMCNRGDEATANTLLGYQRQLIMLEHQNRSQLLRQRQQSIPNSITQLPAFLGFQAAQVANFQPLPAIDARLPRCGFPGKANNCFLRPWEPPISQRYFRRIRSFHIAITFDVPTHSEEARVANDRHLLCDNLHRIVELFINNDQHTIRNLDISITLLGIHVEDTKAKNAAVMHAKALLEPFRRLRNVSRPRVVSISFPEPLPAGRFATLAMTAAQIQGRSRIDLIRDPDSRPVLSQQVKSFIEDLCKNLASSEPAPESPALKYYAMLANTISEISEHPYWLDSDLSDMGRWLEIARAAREENDLKSMKSVYAKMVKKLKEYSSRYKEFMAEAITKMRSINTFFAVIRDCPEA